jgi:hypothetical protein
MEGNAAPRGRGNKKLKIIILTAMIAGAAGTFFIIKSALTGPAEGNIDQTSSRSLNYSAPLITVKNIQAAGKYIRFNYPDSYRPVPIDKPALPQLEAFNFVTKNAPYSELALGVSRLASGNLNDDGSYNMRSLSPDKYKLEKWSVDGAAVPVFVSLQEGYGVAAFITHNGMLLTIAMSGQGDKLQMQKDVQAVLKSLEWQ